MAVERETTLLGPDVHVQLGSDEQALFLDQDWLFELDDGEIYLFYFRCLLGLGFFFWSGARRKLSFHFGFEVVLMIEVELVVGFLVFEASLVEYQLLGVFSFRAREEMDEADCRLMAYGDMELGFGHDCVSEEFDLLDSSKDCVASFHGARSASEASFDCAGV